MALSLSPSLLHRTFDRIPLSLSLSRLSGNTYTLIIFRMRTSCSRTLLFLHSNPRALSPSLLHSSNAKIFFRFSSFLSFSVFFLPFFLFCWWRGHLCTFNGTLVERGLRESAEAFRRFWNWRGLDWWLETWYFFLSFFLSIFSFVSQSI